MDATERMRFGAVAYAAAIALAGCSGGSSAAPPSSGDPPTGPPSLPPPDPVPVALQLFSVEGNQLGDEQRFDGFYILALSGQPLPEVNKGSENIWVYEDRLHPIDAREFDGAQIVWVGSRSYDYSEKDGFQLFESWTSTTLPYWPYFSSGSGWEAAVLSSGEGDAVFDYVSLFETEDQYFDVGFLGTSSSRFLVFGFETLTPMTEGKPSFLGPWRGQIVTGGPGGVGLNGGYNVSGQSWITVDFVTGEVSGIMTPDTITAASSSYGPKPVSEINLSAVSFLGTTDGAFFNGTATATVSILDPVDSMSGTITGAFYGPGAEEVGGVFEMTEPGVRGFTNPDPYVALIGAFAGR